MPEDITQENKPLSVSGALALAKTALENCVVTLVGEVSEVSDKAGYKAVYFSVKDTEATLPAMMWQNRYKASGVVLRVGMLVQLTGRFSLYAAKGRMNFDVFSLSVAGEGDLRQKVAQLAKKLQDEGLMDEARKRPIPSYPERIGLVTSPRGAAVHDVLRTTRRRFPSAQILLAGVPVEGAEAPAHLRAGIECVAAAGAEVILVVRGGGSFEDLMPFNDESLARCISACPVPVVTGIGHEPDNSIADMVADFRASTPTAAAETVAPDSLELSSSLAACEYRISSRLTERLSRSREVLTAIETRPVLADGHNLFANEALSLDVVLDRLQRALPANLRADQAALSASRARLVSVGPGLTQDSMLRLDATSARMRLLAAGIVEPFSARMALSAARLNDLSPLSVLGRGYALAKDEAGNPIKSIKAVAANDHVQVMVSDGTIDCLVEGTTHSDSELISWKDEA